MVKLDVKPWDDETDMKEMERLVKTITMEGLVWGNCQFFKNIIFYLVGFYFKNLLFLFSVTLAPVAYGVKKLVCNCVIEDDKVSTQDLEDQITAFDEYVQSVDIAAFQKL